MSCVPSSRRLIRALGIALIALAPLSAHAASGLGDLYGALQARGRAVTIPAEILARLGLPPSALPGKEIAVTETDRDRRGITAFQVAGVPTLTMFHIETDKNDWWWLRFALDGRVLTEKYGQKDIGIAEVPSAAIAGREIAFWRHWLAQGP